VEVRHEYRSAHGREFRTIKDVFYGEGRVEAVMRTSERHEMSEKVSVSETSISYPMRSLVRVISR